MSFVGMLRTSSVLYNVQCTLYIVQCRVHFECNTGVSVVGMLRTSCVLYNVHCTMYNAEYIFNVIHYYEPRGVSCRYAQVSNAPRMLNLFASLHSVLANIARNMHNKSASAI